MELEVSYAARARAIRCFCPPEREMPFSPTLELNH
jgi:hypothetical protein